MNAPRSLEVRTLEVPTEPPRGGAILKVLANGICGSDYDIYSGVARDAIHATFPMVPGHEIIGEIAEIDDEASRNWGVVAGDRVSVEGFVFCGQCRECQVGDPMACLNRAAYAKTKVDVGSGLWGGMAQYMVLLPGTRVVRLGEDLSTQTAVLINSFSNAFHWAFDQGDLAFGERILILGCGQRGLALAAVAKSAGASQIIVTGLPRDKRKLALAVDSFGATDVIDVEAQDVVSEVMKLTDGKGVDLAVDSTPRAVQPIIDAVRALRRRGRLVLAGVKGQDAAGLFTDEIVLKSLRIVGAAGRSDLSTLRAVAFLSQGEYPFSSLHSYTFGLDEVERGIQMLGGEVPGENPIHITIDPWI
jgi:threonine dehydrogenase-like Zn-dependent dehydrogenase